MDNNMYGGQPQYNYNTPQQNPVFTKYLVLSILEMICCCQITGVIALVLTILANSDFKAGNFVGFESKTKSAKTTLIVGLVIGLVAGIALFFLYGVAILAEINNY